MKDGLDGWKDVMKTYGVSVTSDGWSSNDKRHFMNLVAITNNGPVFVDAVDTAECDSPAGKDATYVASIMIKAIEGLGPENVVSIVTDGAAVMKAAWDIVTAKFPHIVSGWCASHVLDLLMEDIGKMSAFSQDIAKVKEIVKFINNHEWTFSRFQEKRSVFFSLSALSDISTKCWNTIA